jgi:hypothetical protein
MLDAPMTCLLFNGCLNRNTGAFAFGGVEGKPRAKGVGPGRHIGQSVASTECAARGEPDAIIADL